MALLRDPAVLTGVGRRSADPDRLGDAAGIPFALM
jgi:hypothetical protein